MGEWVDITITGRDKQLSEQPSIKDSELSRQVFTLSDSPRSSGCRYVMPPLLLSPADSSGRQK